LQYSGERETSMTNLAVNPSILKTVPLFALFSDHQLAALFPAIQHRTYPRHSFMLRAGERSDALYIILAGRAKIVIYDGEGREEPDRREAALGER
jgi:CRP/FNR family cyclic AMP-dependent transcriptional regulator